jgi:hypothetical protein
MVGGCHGEVFDRAGSLQTAIYSIEYIGDNSTAALSSQPSHFSVRGRICVDSKFSPGFQILQIGFQMLPDPINATSWFRKGERRATEVAVAVRVLNQMSELGRPISVRIA